MTRHGKLPERHARFYGACLILALQHIHSRGIIYRDLKLENVMIDALGYIKIDDFGFAKGLQGDSERTYTMCGTPQYMAPEMLKAVGYGKYVPSFLVIYV